MRAAPDAGKQSSKDDEPSHWRLMTPKFADLADVGVRPEGQAELLARVDQ